MTAPTHRVIADPYFSLSTGRRDQTHLHKGALVTLGTGSDATPDSRGDVWVHGPSGKYVPVALAVLEPVTPGTTATIARDALIEVLVDGGAPVKTAAIFADAAENRSRA